MVARRITTDAAPENAVVRVDGLDPVLVQEGREHGDTDGLPDVNTLSLLAGCRYLLKLTFNDVLPLPNTS